MPETTEQPKSDLPGRRWRSLAQDDGSLHCLGNGRLCVYEQGPEIIQVFGPPYSAPSVGQICCEPIAGLEAVSQREQGSPVWHHQLLLDGTIIGELVDLVDSRLACLVRQVHLGRPFTFRLALDVPHRRVQKKLSGADGGLLIEIPAGLFFFHEYPVPLPAFYQLAWQGKIQVEADPQEHELHITCQAGDGQLFLAGGPAYPQAVETAEKAVQTGFGGLLARTRQDWKAFVSPHQKLESISTGLSQPSALFQAVEDTALLIKTQQAAEGGILAGHIYHWAGMRDQYGVARGLLRMGHVAEAQQILEFYWNIWQRHGRLHNGLGIGVEAFHVHENDRVEITGYLVCQAFDLLAATGDDTFLDKIFPMLDWAFQSQAGQLVEGMLPFNGDETYVAGGILPRSALNDGSAEATLLFLLGGEKLASWAGRSSRWDSRKLDWAQRVLTDTRLRYRANFYPNGRLLTNQPRRAERIEPPRFRHGVCERCLVEPSRPIAAIWTERSDAGRYLCPDCLAKGDFPAYLPRTYQLNSVSLTPLYFGSDLISSQELRPVAQDAIG